MKNNLTKQILLGVDITNATQEEILEYIFSSLENSLKPYYIVTPNPEMLVLSQKRNEFNRALNQALLALPDGVGITIAGQLLGIPFKERVTGTDILEEVCKMIVNLNKKQVKNAITVGFLGGRENVAQKTADCLREKYPGLAVAFAGEEWPKAAPLHLWTSEPQIDILFVAFGFPKQEEWMHDHVGKIPVKIMIGVGGAFDYISGNVSRAPKFIRSIGLEWLYRLIRQPWRVKRQLALITFVFLVLSERFNRSHSK